MKQISAILARKLDSHKFLYENAAECPAQWAGTNAANLKIG
jgi:hypothetical protein